MNISAFSLPPKLRPRGTRNDVYRCRQKLLNWTAKASRRNVVWIFPKETSYRCYSRVACATLSRIHETRTKSINKLPVLGFPRALSEYRRVGSFCTRILFLRVNFVFPRPKMLFLAANRAIGQYPFYWLLLFLFRRLYAKMLFRSLGCPYLMT